MRNLECIFQVAQFQYKGKDMKVPDNLRSDMLGVIKTDVLAGVKKIQFYNDAALLLAEMGYSEIDSIAASQTYLRFKRITGATTSDLITTVAATGIVSNFKIPTNTYGNITGSVGSIGTQTDIQFTAVSWVANSIIRISDLIMILEQGI